MKILKEYRSVPVKWGAILLLLCFFSSGYAQQKPKYLDPQQPVSERVKDLMGRMSLDMKIAQMCQYVGLEHMRDAEKNITEEELLSGHARGFYKGLHSSGVERMVKQGLIGSFLHVLTIEEANHLQKLAEESPLKIPLLMGIDAIHGNGLMSGSTIYPSPITMASTFAPDLIEESFRQTALEMRATGMHWAFSPNIEIARDPRWGRVGETFGEDPYLVSQMGIASVRGLQMDKLDKDKSVLACVKHMAGGGIGNNGTNASPVEIGEGELRNVILAPFKATIRQTQPFSLMPAHNEINGTPGHADKWLLTEVARNEYGFKGFIISDWMDMERLSQTHRIAATIKEAFQISVDAGVDMHMHGPGFLESIKELIEEGKLSEERINRACEKILEAKFMLGLFENRYADPKNLSETVFIKEHRQTALEIARKGIVLLKNKNNILPIAVNKYKNILVTGPNADNQSIMGDWVFDQPRSNYKTVLDGIKMLSEGSNVNYVDVGWNLRDLNNDSITKAIETADKMDLIILALGEDSFRQHWKEKTAGENRDRMDITLWGKQQYLVEELKKSGKPIVVVLVNGRPLATPWLEENVDAILEAWEPGSFGGQAVAEILYGKVNPSGKLPITIPRHVGQIPIYYYHKPSQYSHAFIDGAKEPLYDFGYGLSYTDFQYSELKCPKDLKYGEPLHVTLTVENTGEMEGEEVVQLYLKDDFSSTTRPVKLLVGFRRIHLEKGEKKTMVFSLDKEVFGYYNNKGKYVFEPGSFTLMVGGSSLGKDQIFQKVTVNN
ncbi:glycoside hydrolase family 3 N-terminal domain-containing protein [Proteiniphilum acetatigenes]|uniref:glycoside hydrolase family 3 N-terminal domain-containing protein n=1 Tax=Proteiniphilum acetatigenes TaxID=294710 RepID=UPI00035F33C7|nr:glycoside hydrolase family 3 N-terminal domain-containing protein [Proteiniphilum acetatigenes]